MSAVYKETHCLLHEVCLYQCYVECKWAMKKVYDPNIPVVTLAGLYSGDSATLHQVLIVP